ncbi:aspartyl-tRNA synthetase [Alkalihalobacterium elongatum]|uniref:aspartyl-tRNA synthetase n=1 Tax=Alkalihalobacterium elongatum TaxID=2675466 RepID=UPI001C1FCAD6|nr:aspartyl-tRNA synthetase [Alkalihalobacterium elongatum]
MEKRSNHKTSLLILLGITLVLSAFWINSERSMSYPEPHEAMFANDKNLVLIPAYKLNNEALFFFIKDQQFFGAAKLNKGLFGWKQPLMAWDPMSDRSTYDIPGSLQGYGDYLVYGLIKNNDADYRIEVNEKDAVILPFAMLPPEKVKAYELEDLYLWYFESKEPLHHGRIEFLNRDTLELIERVDF